jgi:hypothetical protein
MPEKMESELNPIEIATATGLLGEVKDVLNALAETNVEPAQVRSLARQARRDLSAVRNVFEKLARREPKTGQC